MYWRKTAKNYLSVHELYNVTFTNYFKSKEMPRFDVIKDILKGFSVSYGQKMNKTNKKTLT